MNVTDPIADMLTRIRNAIAAGHEALELPCSRTKVEIARILKSEGYIIDYAVDGRVPRRNLRIFLKYMPDGHSVVRGLRRVSRSGRRRYASAREIPKVLNGLGVAVVSTSSGIMTDREARRRKSGGEILCDIW